MKVHCHVSRAAAGRPEGRFRFGADRGGSRGMAGAVAMAAWRPAAARRLVRVAVPEIIPGLCRQFRAVVYDHPVAFRPGGPNRRRHARPHHRTGEKAHYQMQQQLPSAFDSIAPGRRSPRPSLCPAAGPSLSLDELIARLYQEMAKPMVSMPTPERFGNRAGSAGAPVGRAFSRAPGEFARLVGRKLDARRATTPRFNWRPARTSWWCSRAPHAGHRTDAAGRSIPRATRVWPPAARATC